ncbi:MAG: Holliday junction branch migration protein RuvA [Firmicutes bacterium]|nr:Holliday junction branch migration protein RuvA [Bacillota bacterium]
MFSYLCGRLVQKGKDFVIVDNHGIGYRLAVPASSLAMMPGSEEEVKLYTYLAVREDGMALYGFLTVAEQDLFELLLSVSGIGPKASLAVLSALPPDAFCLAVLQENVQTLTRVPGIGPKSAKRLILELKDRVAVPDIRAIPQTVMGQGAGDVYSDAFAALVSLGYSGAEAQAALQEARGNGEKELSGPALVKGALRQLGQLPASAGTSPSPKKGGKD